jgi:hypothetical protein
MRQESDGWERIDAVIPRVIAATDDVSLVPRLPLDLRPAREQLRAIERTVQRALWRAEKRSRRRPLHVRRSASWIHACRRRIARELYRWALSEELDRERARAIAARACERFPRDGIVHVDGEQLRPRELGTSPRQVGRAPRQLGSSPRQMGRSPRQLRERRAEP